MLLIIHNLPGNITYNELKDLIWKNCGLQEIILDKLVSDKPGTKQVTVGLAEESDAAILTRKINGIYLNGYQLFVKNVRQRKESEQPYHTSSQILQDSTPTVNHSMQDPSMAYNMYQHSMFYGNMSYFMPSASNAMMQALAPSNQPLYQNNIPFYQQAQNVGLQQGAAACQQSILNSTHYSERPQSNSMQGHHNKDGGQSYGVYEQSGRDCDHDSRDRKKSGSNDPRDREAKWVSSYSRDGNTSKRKAKRDGGESYDRNRDQRRDRDQNRQERGQTYNAQDRANRKPSQANTQRNPYKVDYRNISNQPNTKKIPVWEIGPQSNSQNSNPPFMANLDTPRQPAANLNKQSRFALPQGNSQQRNQANVEGNLKRKFNNQSPSNTSQRKKKRPSAQQQTQQLDGPQFQKSNENNKLTKKPKFEELDEKEKMIKLNLWVQNAAATITKGMLADANPPKKFGGALYKELKKCITSRLFVIYSNRLPTSLAQVSADYRDKFRQEDDKAFFNGVLAKVKEEWRSSSFIIAPSSNSKELEDHQPTAPRPQQKNKPAESRKPQSQKIEVTSSATSFNRAPVIQGKLPTYPNNDKRLDIKYRQEYLQQFLGLSQFELPKHQRAALDAEIKELDDLYSQACQEVDSMLERPFKKSWNQSKDYFSRALSIHTSRRLLNMTSYLAVQVNFTPKKPCKETLENFLKQYGVISLKKSVRRQMFVASCSSFEGYDALLKLGETYMDDSTVSFGPLNFSGPSMLKLLKAKEKLKQGTTNHKKGSDEDCSDEIVFDHEDGDNDDDYDDEDEDGDGDENITIKQENTDTHDETIYQSKDVKDNGDTKQDKSDNCEYIPNENKGTVENLNENNVVGDNNNAVIDNLDDNGCKNGSKNEEVNQIDDKIDMEVTEIAEEDLEDF